MNKMIYKGEDSENADSHQPIPAKLSLSPSEIAEREAIILDSYPFIPVKRPMSREQQIMRAMIIGLCRKAWAYRKRARKQGIVPYIMGAEIQCQNCLMLIQAYKLAWKIGANK